MSGCLQQVPLVVDGSWLGKVAGKWDSEVSAMMDEKSCDAIHLEGRAELIADLG